MAEINLCLHVIGNIVYKLVSFIARCTLADRPIPVGKMVSLVSSVHAGHVRAAEVAASGFRRQVPPAPVCVAGRPVVVAPDVSLSRRVPQYVTVVSG